MGDDALIKNVFGSDSDSDSDDGPAAKPAVSPAKGDDVQKDRPAEDAPEDGAEAAGRPAGFKSSLEENLSDFEDDEEKKEEEFGTRSRTHARAPRSPIAANGCGSARDDLWWIIHDQHTKCAAGFSVSVGFSDTYYVLLHHRPGPLHHPVSLYLSISPPLRLSLSLSLTHLTAPPSRSCWRTPQKH